MTVRSQQSLRDFVSAVERAHPELVLRVTVSLFTARCSHTISMTRCSTDTLNPPGRLRYQPNRD